MVHTIDKPIALPRFDVDHAKCTTPFLCKRCLQVCPHAIFMVQVTNEERLKETDPRLPGTYRLYAIRRDKCTVCRKCEEVCPVGALKVGYPQEAR
jgi:ferredoxin